MINLINYFFLAAEKKDLNKFKRTASRVLATSTEKNGFFDSLRAECRREHIKVLIVCPGYIRTQVSVNAFIGTGEKQGTMDEARAKSIPPEVCTARILAAIRADKEKNQRGRRQRTARSLFEALFPCLVFQDGAQNQSSASSLSETPFG